GGTSGWSDDRIETMLGHYSIDSFSARHAVIPCKRCDVLLLSERAFLLRLKHYLRTKPLQLPILVTLIEIDDVLERFHRRLGAERCEIRVEICLEFVKQNFELGVIEFSKRRNVGGI